MQPVPHQKCGLGARLRVVTSLLALSQSSIARINEFMSAASRLGSLCSTEALRVLLQLCLWSELGVLTRSYLGRLFNDGCADGWGLCLTSQSTRDKQYGAEFFDLPANMLGCFFMGFLSTSSVLGLKSKKSLAFLPASSWLQHEKELQVGLRTGYCGSLTTFASWELSLLQLLIGSKGGDGGQWQQWLWGHIIGFELAYASHLIGEHAALGIHRWFLREGAQDPDKEEVTDLERPTDPQEEGEDLYGSNEFNEVFADSHRPGKPEVTHGGANGNKADSCNLDQSTGAGAEANGAAGSYQHPSARQQQGSDLEDGKQPRHRKSSAPVNREQFQEQKAPSNDEPSVGAKLHLTTACAMLCALLTVLWVVLVILDSEEKHSGRRQHWFALLFAPFGCVLRWLLSKLNTMERPLRWFPVGTFAANMIACSIDFIVGGLTNRYNLGYWPMVILPAIRVGYAGSLSTVSTFIAEVRHILVTTSTRCAKRNAPSRVMYMLTFEEMEFCARLLSAWCLATHAPYILVFAWFTCLRSESSCFAYSKCFLLLQVRAQLQGWPEKLHGYLYPFITFVTSTVLGVILYGWSVWRTL